MKVKIELECDPDMAQRLLALYDLLSVDSREDALDFTCSVSATTASRALSLVRDKVREVYIDTGMEAELDDNIEIIEFARLLNYQPC